MQLLNLARAGLFVRDFFNTGPSYRNTSGTVFIYLSDATSVWSSGAASVDNFFFQDGEERGGGQVGGKRRAKLNVYAVMETQQCFFIHGPILQTNQSSSGCAVSHFPRNMSAGSSVTRTVFKSYTGMGLYLRQEKNQS